MIGHVLQCEPCSLHGKQTVLPEYTVEKKLLPPRQTKVWIIIPKKKKATRKKYDTNMTSFIVATELSWKLCHALLSSKPNTSFDAN